MNTEDLKRAMVGRWKSMLPLFGVETRYFSGKHSDCPICRSGKDKYRFDDKGGNGTWFCSSCGAGDGFSFISKYKGISFVEAKALVESHLGETSIIVPRAAKNETEEAARFRDRMNNLWRMAYPLDGEDPASRYLLARGIKPAKWPGHIRAIDELIYLDDDKIRSVHPGMLARFTPSDGPGVTLHRTFLDGTGGKAAVSKTKMLMPGKVPQGGAVRLFPPAETLGIAEGIETALSAAQIFGVPVWAALTSGLMLKWIPPAETRCVMIFGDNDASFTGQYAAYGLAYVLKNKGLHVDVRMPDEIGEDWNDVLVGRGIS